MIERDYYREIWREFDEDKHLVLISGPRQAGKTTLAKAIASDEEASQYFNYDVPANKAKLQANPTFFEEIDRPGNVLPLVILDEIHKYKDWKNYLKGVYDGFGEEYRFLVTGSGRLDLFQRSGESLAGRYFQFHLFPFTMGEMFAKGVGGKTDEQGLLEPPETGSEEIYSTWDNLYRFSGFPEPFVKGTERAYFRWAGTYHRQIIREDIRDAFAVKKLDDMETLYALLTPRVGNLLSTASLVAQLKVSHNTVSSWLRVFERFMLIFKVRPYSRKISRSIVKEPKFYFYDTGRVEDEGARFENMVALELKRATTIWTDYGLGEFELRFVRTKEQEEVDFLVIRGGKPFFLVEAKTNETTVSRSLIKFQSQLKVPAIQLVNRPGIGRVIRNESHRILVTSAPAWLATLG
jgi:predicted AAA+ superfamily ATPase